MIRRLIFTALCALALAAAAQTDPQFTQFYELPSVYNPAAIGLGDNISLRGAGRLQWVGIDGAPQTFVLAANMPLRIASQRLGLGVVMQQESLGLYHTLSLGAQAGYKYKLFGGEFTAALQLGMYDQRFDGSAAFVPDGDDYHQGADDAIPTTDLHGTALDLGIGLWFRHKRWHAGFSATHLTAPTIKLAPEAGSGSEQTVYEFNARRTLYLMGGCNIPLNNTLFELAPSILVKTDLTYTGAELMARAIYNRFLVFGIGYRWDDAVTVTAGARVKDFFIGYSFDYATSALHSASAGSHELVVGYAFKLDMGDRNRNRHRSIRFM